MTAPATATRPGGTGRFAPLVTLALDVALPIAVVYGARALGATMWQALIAASVIPLLLILGRFARQRVVDYPALFVLTMLALSVGLSMVTGSPRALLIRDSWLWIIVGAAGVWMLASTMVGRPALFVMFRSFVLTKVGPRGLRDWEARWDSESGFRRGIRVLTVVWGLATVLNGVAHVVGAFTLPLEIAPAVLGFVWPVILAPLLTFHIVYTKRKDLRA